MIKFFRHIRKDLMEKNKIGMYLKYAIGEIVLVMIGILLALQVNEWNNEQNRKRAEGIIIEQLKSDLKKSKNELEEIMKDLRERARASALVCHAFWKKDTPHDSIYKYLRLPIGTSIYSPTLGTARSLINSGNISLLKSERLKNAITSYVEEVDYKLKDINRYEETYFRNGVMQLKEVAQFSNLMPKESLLKLIEESNTPNFETSRNDEFSQLPNVVEKIPFEISLQELFLEKKVFDAYSSLLIVHRNSAVRYNDILDITGELLDKIEEISSNPE